MLRDYHEYYKRECKRIFTHKLNMYKNLLMSPKQSSPVLAKASAPIFLPKGTATKIWKDLVLDGLSLQNKWQQCDFVKEAFENKVFKYLGESVFEVLKSPDLTVPALIKEDNNVDFHSVYSQYLYEYLFRMKSVCSGKKPAATFTFLSEKESKIKKAFAEALCNVDEMAQDVKFNDEAQTLLNFRWYCANPKLTYYSDNSTYASTQFTNSLVDILRAPNSKSCLTALLTHLFETLTFHCKLVFEMVSEQDDELAFLQEYDKRWNGYVASMIKIDEMLSPLAQIVNKVYKRVFPGFPCFPQFSFLRFFVFIWRREVYNM